MNAAEASCCLLVNRFPKNEKTYSQTVVQSIPETILMKVMSDPMRTENFDFSGHNGFQLPAVLWLPDSEPKAILQIIHGMTEHIGRYTVFAQEMTKLGIAVAGYDLRGHGRNSGDSDIASFGEEGWNASLQDMRLFFDFLKKRFLEIPHHMLGFSLGSFLLRALSSWA